MCLGGIFNAIRKPIAMLANGFPRSQWPRTEGEMRECGLTLQLQHVVPRATAEMQSSSPLLSPAVSLPRPLQPVVTASQTHTLLPCGSPKQLAGLILWFLETSIQDKVSPLCHPGHTTRASPTLPCGQLGTERLLDPKQK